MTGINTTPCCKTWLKNPGLSSTPTMEGLWRWFTISPTTCPQHSLGKLLGWEAANIALVAWSILGVMLACILFLHASSLRRLWFTPFYFLFFSGLDIVGSLLTHSPLNFSMARKSLSRSMETTGSIMMPGAPGNIAATLKLLFTVPKSSHRRMANHRIDCPVPPFTAPPFTLFLFFWGISIFWSPFLTIGLFTDRFCSPSFPH
jgi:hypothetical protein